MEDREVLQGFLEEDKLVVEVATVREPVEGPEERGKGAFEVGEDELG